MYVGGSEVTLHIDKMIHLAFKVHLWDDLKLELNVSLQAEGKL